MWNILSNAIFTTPGNIRRNPCASSVVPESLVAPVARATLLSLLCISCLLHVWVHPDRSARFARFVRSTHCARPANFNPSLHALRPFWPVLVPLKLSRHHNKNHTTQEVSKRLPKRQRECPKRGQEDSRRAPTSKKTMFFTGGF